MRAKRDTIKHHSFGLTLHSQVWWSSADGYHISQCCGEHRQTSQKPRWLLPAALGRQWQKKHPRMLEGYIFKWPIRSTRYGRLTIEQPLITEFWFWSKRLTSVSLWELKESSEQSLCVLHQPCKQNKTLAMGMTFMEGELGELNVLYLCRALLFSLVLLVFLPIHLQN